MRQEPFVYRLQRQDSRAADKAENELKGRT